MGFGTVRMAGAVLFFVASIAGLGYLTLYQGLICGVGQWITALNVGNEIGYGMGLLRILLSVPLFLVGLGGLTVLSVAIAGGEDE